MNQSTDSRKDRKRDYNRGMLRGGLVSLFWSVISERRKRESFTFSEFARRVDVDKSAVSRWFNAPPPNWTLDTVADIGAALDVDIELVAVDRRTGQKYTPAGVVSAWVVKDDGNLSRYHIGAEIIDSQHHGDQQSCVASVL
ncbi:helix-turn-helix transcriptional regulator [Gluconacetobacter diazotrophicus]|uniref:Helix-turn-helix transcriptional regulator n=1 Tax=Gluconacetobacter diazotrophicus TaxID=33996 RepID=A0A7W4I8M2_GLUDI|nr:helix-turn-helix transcriptional regulator [Gluconacetobacter diazotrophicus]